MYLGGPLGLMSIGLMAILVRGLGLLMLGVASTAGQLLGSVLIDVLIPSLGNTVYLVTIIGTLFALVGFAPIFPDICYHLTHYKPAAADIPVASDNPAH
ncbi:DMT family transporter, partial [Escherichia coli]|nr:DMT family transporter [Escherichia coli]